MLDALKINEKWQDLAIEMGIVIAQLGEAEARKIEKLLSRAYADIISENIASMKFGRGGLDFSWRTLPEFKELLKKSEEEIALALRDARERTEKLLTEVGILEHENAIRMLQQVKITSLGLGGPNLTLIRQLVKSRPFQGAILKDWYRGLEAGTQQIYRRAVTNGLAIGASNAQIAEQVAKDLGIKAQQAASVTRTAVTHVSNRAREATFHKLGIKEVRYVAVLDVRTTDICASLDGKIFKVGRGERPPMHMQCRSTVVPFVDGSIGGVRASSSGYVPAKTTYYEWLERQPLAKQEKALGKARAADFRSGKLTAKQIVKATLN